MRKGERRYVEVFEGELWIALLTGAPTRKGTVSVEWQSGPLKGRPANVVTSALGEEVR